VIKFKGSKKIITTGRVACCEKKPGLFFTGYCISIDNKKEKNELATAVQKDG
jgi:hypothetical protein